jgi:hypothetical protein
VFPIEGSCVHKVYMGQLPHVFNRSVICPQSDNTTEHLLRKILIPEYLIDPPDNQGKLYYTVTPVLRGHLWDKQKVAYKTGELLKEVKSVHGTVATCFQ